MHGQKLTAPSLPAKLQLMNIYQKADDRRQQILSAACDLAEKTHYRQIRRHHLVQACDTAAGNISRVMGDMDALRYQLIEFALQHERSAVIVQAIVDKHPAVDSISATARRKYLAAV